MTYDYKEDKLTKKATEYFRKRESIHFVLGLVVGLIVGFIPTIFYAIVIVLAIYFGIKYWKGR
jgi:preprotein translocase subunit SecF